MMRRAPFLAWSLRIATWAVIAYPLAQWAWRPHRRWFDGRFIQLLIYGESGSASDDLLKNLGLAACYPMADVTFDAPDLWLDDKSLYNRSETRVELIARGDEFFFPFLELSRDAQPRMPLFWRGDFDERFTLVTTDGELLETGIKRGYGEDGLGNNNGYLPMRHWQVWYWCNNQWTCALRVDMGDMLDLRFDFEPTKERVQSIVCHELNDATNTDSILARFDWDAAARTFRPTFSGDVEPRILPPYPTLTIENPFAGADKEGDENNDDPDESAPAASQAAP